MTMLSAKAPRWTSGITRTATSLGMKWACRRNSLSIRVKFGGYLLHEVYNAHNLFYNSAYGGSGAQQVVSADRSFAPVTSSRTMWRFMPRTMFTPFHKYTLFPECAWLDSPRVTAIRRSATLNFFLA